MADAAVPLSEKGKLFWNAYNNIRNEITADPANYDFNRETLTYVEADDRYLDYVKLYLDGSNLPAADKTNQLAQAQDAHDQSVKTLDDSAGFDTEMFKLSDDFYTNIDKSYADMKPVAAPAEIVQANVPANPVIPAAPAFSSDWAKAQLGDLADEPKTPIALVTQPIKPEAIPVVVRPAKPAEIDLSTVVQNAPVVEKITDYTVEKGDSLWRIAKEHFGLTNDRDIVQAVTAIANLNDMEDGANPNHLKIGQIIKLPDSPLPAKDDKALDWKAMNADPLIKSTLRSRFKGATDNDDADDGMDDDITPAPTPQPMPSFLRMGL